PPGGRGRAGRGLSVTDATGMTERSTGVELGDKVCVVTGGASGIGRAAAIALAAKGARFVVGDVDASGGEKTAAIITEAGGEAVFAACDVSREQEASGLID